MDVALITELHVFMFCVSVGVVSVYASFPLCGLMRQQGPNLSVCDCISPQGPWIKHVYTTDTEFESGKEERMLLSHYLLV